MSSLVLSINIGLAKFKPILDGGGKLIKPALQWMTSYRLVIEELKDTEVITNYTRWVEAVQ